MILNEHDHLCIISKDVVEVVQNNVPIVQIGSVFIQMENERYSGQVTFRIALCLSQNLK